MAKRKHIALDDWIRLFLLNWVMISFVMFYSIAAGIITSSLLILTIGNFLKSMNDGKALLTFYPELSIGTAVIIAGWILHLFLNTVHLMRYDCRTKTYVFQRAAFNRRAILRFAGVGAGIILAGVGIEFWNAGG